MSLIEVMIVISIIGILAVYLTDAYRQWVSRYRAENEIKELYAGLVDARARAMTRNRIHFVTLAATSYVVTEDTNPAPDGDGAFDAGDRTVLQQPTTAPLAFPLAWTLASGGGTTRFAFNRDGIAQDSGFIRLNTAVSADYDCISLSSTRINLGRFNGATCQDR